MCISRRPPRGAWIETRTLEGPPRRVSTVAPRVGARIGTPAPAPLTESALLQRRPRVGGVDWKPTLAFSASSSFVVAPAWGAWI